MVNLKNQLQNVYSIYYLELIGYLLIIKLEIYLSNANLMVNEAIEEKIKKLQLIKDEIKEDINKIKIHDNTILTL